MNAWVWLGTVGWPWFVVALVVVVMLVILATLTSLLTFIIKSFGKGFAKGVDQHAAMTRVASGVSTVNEERAAAGFPPSQAPSSYIADVTTLPRIPRG